MNTNSFALLHHYQYFIYAKLDVKTNFSIQPTFQIIYFLINLDSLNFSFKFNFIFKNNFLTLQYTKPSLYFLKTETPFYMLNKFVIIRYSTHFKQYYKNFNHNNYKKKYLNQLVLQKKTIRLELKKTFNFFKNYFLFFNSYSLNLLKALSTSLKRLHLKYDSFFISSDFFLNSNKFEMNFTALNFNKNLMIKLRNFYRYKKKMIAHKNLNPFSMQPYLNLENNVIINSPDLQTPALNNFWNNNKLSYFYDANATSRPTFGALLLSKNMKNILMNFTSPFLFKYICFHQLINKSFFIANMFSTFYFYNKTSNLFVNKSFSYFIKKKLIKIFNFKKFSMLSTPWQYNSLIRFLQVCSGSKILLKFFFFLNFFLNENEKLRCILWFQKLKTFQRSIGNGFFLYESIEIIYIALKIKDPYFLISWISRTLHKINFWKHRAFFHYLRYVFKYFFFEIFNELGIKGIKFRLKGKISVTGNARTRKINCVIGNTSMSTYENRILHTLDLIRTFTGVMGLQIWLFF